MRWQIFMVTLVFVVHLIPLSGQESKAQVLLENALQLATEKSYVEARSALLDYLDRYPQDAGVYRAKLALAELSILEFPPRVQTARRQLQDTAELNLPPAARLRRDYIALWIEDAAQDKLAFEKLSRVFIKDHPAAKQRQGVMMKLAKHYYENAQYGKARDLFLNIAEDYPDSELAAPAQYFAGKAAASLLDPNGLDRAIDIWAPLARGEGEGALLARLQQGIAKRRLGSIAEAISVYDNILDGRESLPPSFRLEVLFEKARSALLLARNSVILEEKAFIAIKELEGFCLPGTSESYRAKQLLAEFHNLMEESDKALEVHRDIVAEIEEFALERNRKDLSMSKSGKDRQGLLEESKAMLNYYFQSGFVYLQQLEEEEQWTKAVEQADRMAAVAKQAAPALSAQAAERAERLRLEHFLWKETP